MASEPNYDDDYLIVADRYNNGNQEVIAVGGDSHGKRLFYEFERLVAGFAGNFASLNLSFAVGGAHAHSYRKLQEYFDMRFNYGFQIVIIEIGSNDVDSTNPNILPMTIAQHIINIFIELTLEDKVVYVVGLPTRFTTRHFQVDKYNAVNRAVNFKLANLLGNRFIRLPASCYERYAYRTEGDSIVHLYPHHYVTVAQIVTEHIHNDLENRSSLPSTVPCIRYYLENDNE